MNLNLSDSKNHQNNNNNEEKIIKHLVNEIYQYESNIELITNELKNATNDIHKNIQLKDLNIKKEILNLKIANLNLSLSNSTSTYNALIQQKDALMTELELKISKLKEELNNKDINNFKSIHMIKHILSNSFGNAFLSEEQILDIINENQKIINNGKNKKYILNNEIKIINEILSEINRKEKEINLKIDEIKEIILMLKEEKESTKRELINLISYKESIDTIIKINLHNMIKDNSLETIINNNENNINNPKEPKNKWTEPIKLYFYEISSLNPIDIAKSLSDNIFSILDINNDNLILNNEKDNDNKDNENDKFKDSTTFNKNIISNTNFEDNDFSLNISSILPKEKYNSKNILKNLIKKEFENFFNLNVNKINSFNSIEQFLDKISGLLISEMEKMSNNMNINNNYCISQNNLIIYLSYFMKSFYYKNIIDIKIKFINKEYKNIKNIYKQKLNKLKLDFDIYNNNKYKLNDRIKISQEQLKSLDNNQNTINDLKIDTDEENYLNICKEGNRLICQKKKINDIICLYKDKIKIQENMINNEINKIKNELDVINKEINVINKGFENEKIKANEKIIENRKIISEKYKKIKNIFNSFKNKHGNNIPIYNNLLNCINETLINKTKNQNIIQSSYKNRRKNKDSIDLNVNISNIEKKSSFKEKEDNKELSSTIIKSLNYVAKSHNDKRNCIKERDYSDNESNSNSFFYKPNTKKDYQEYYNIINNNSKKGTSNINSHKNCTNLFLKRNYQKMDNNKITKIKHNNSKTNYIPKYKKKIENNNIIYNNNFYLTNNMNDYYKSYINFNNQKANQKMIPKAKSLTNFYNPPKHSEKVNKLKISTYKHNKKLFSSSIFYKKINYSLINNTFCYYREIRKENKTKFNPFENSIKNICGQPFNFHPCIICFNNAFNTLKISVENNSEMSYNISINEIENTIVSSLIKLVVEIYRKFNKIKGNENDKKEIIEFFLEKFVEEEKGNYPQLSQEEIKKCALNKLFDFSILLKDGKRIEFIMTCYEDFKEWINGLSIIIKNKEYIFSTFEEK